VSVTKTWIPLTALTPALISACSPSPVPIDPVGGAPAGAITPQIMGQRLFEDLCASCHGVDARGGGSLSHLLRIETPDLTRISAGNGGTFPRAVVRAKIDGTDDVEAHGTRVMPVWGRSLRPNPESDSEADRTVAERQINDLVEHLSSIQDHSPL
jgi:mono/diheme cytochrome c family protein